MPKVLGFILILMLSFQSWGQINASIKGYREWKVEKVQLASNQALGLKSQLAKAKADGNRKLAEALERQLNQLNWNLEVVQDLSVADYFVLYLSRQSQADRFQKAAQKMSTVEVAELMEAYADTLSISAPAEVVTRPAAAPNRHQGQIPAHALGRTTQIK